MAAQHGYLLTNAPLSAAMVPQRMCMQEARWVRINGVIVARLLRRDRQGRALPAWRTYQRLVGDELLLLSSINPKSFDSRHFFPLSVGGMIVLAQLLCSDSCR